LEVIEHFRYCVSQLELFNLFGQDRANQAQGNQEVIFNFRFIKMEFMLMQDVPIK